MNKKSLYIVCKTLDQPIRVFGLPLDEFIFMIISSSFLFISGKQVLGVVIAILSVVLIKILKKGQGSGWLLNVCYWYLPEIFLKPFLRFTPASHKREWIG